MNNVAGDVPTPLTQLAARWMTLQTGLAERVLHRRAPCRAETNDVVQQEELLALLHSEEQFFATLLHELRNPLLPIANALDLLASRGDDPKTVIGARGVIQLQLRQLMRIANDLRNASRIARDAIELHQERIDVTDVIAAAVEAARPAIELRERWSQRVSKEGARIRPGSNFATADEGRPSFMNNTG